MKFITFALYETFKKTSCIPNRQTLKTIFQCYKDTFQDNTFNLAPVFENTILTILNIAKAFKTTALDFEILQL